MPSIDSLGASGSDGPFVSLRTIVPLNDLKRQFDSLGYELANVIQQVAASGCYILGSRVEKFEAEFADYCGTRQCVGVANGTDALEIALRAVGCGPGADVATVANAGAYATTAIIATGARPVLVDIEPATMTMSPDCLARSIGPTLKAVIVTHLYGQLADMDAISAITGSSIPIIEDCAHAHGARRGGRRAGTFGAVGCFSFYPTKNLGALGDGGAIVTADASLAEAARKLRQYGWQSKYRPIVPGGRNSRLDEIQAAVLSVKLPFLDDWNVKRREIAMQYRRILKGYANFALPSVDHVSHLCVLRTPRRSRLQEHFSRHGIATEIHYPVPDHKQAAFRGFFPSDLRLPETEDAAEQVLTLPCFPEMTREEIAYICDSLVNFTQLSGSDVRRGSHSVQDV